jgi:hypothetical protein
VLVMVKTKVMATIKYLRWKALKRVKMLQAHLAALEAASET